MTVLTLALPATAPGAPSSQGISPQGISPQGISPQGISPQGISPQGISPQGISPQGISPQGTQASGVALLGTDLLAAELRGVDIGSVEIRGTTAASDVQPFELTSGPGISTGAGDYISVGGASAAGHYAVAHLVDAAGAAAEDLDLYIADERADPVPNLFHRGDDQQNDDVTLYTVFFFHKWSGQWASLCPFHAATGGATAMAIAEDPAQPNRFIFACTASGVAAKCARNWGFRPWRTDQTFVFDDGTNDWVEQTFALKPFYDACKIAARAAYCQDRQSFTRNGTLIDLFDTRQFVWPNAIENPFGDDPDSRWMFTQEFFVSVAPLQSHPQLMASALQRTRYRELSPIGQCAGLAFVDRLEQDHFEDGRWASPLTGTPRIQVMSPNYCAHNEHEVGAALAWDCSPCTTSVCKQQPRCCRLDQPGDVWDALCVDQAAVSCNDPPGRVWPRDLPATPAPPQKFLLGPGGAVERLDGSGTDADADAATISGWACDPEWPGAAVTVAIYAGAPREQPGTTLLGLAYADQALASPLAREVSAACDGPGRASARHGFSFTVPPGAGGHAFVYALDTATPDGPAAPPTLLRNGIVDLTGTIGRGRPVAAVTTGWIEAPASGSYTFSSPVEPSRLFVNGQTLVDWWDGPGPTQGSIDLLGGGRYHVRWDRAGSPPPGQGPVDGVTWQTPDSDGQTPIPAALLYRLAPGGGQGLAATYFDDPHFAGPSIQRQDPAVDLGVGPPETVRLPAGIAPSTLSVVWEGEVVPLYSEAYTFSVTSAGVADLSIAGQELLPPEIPRPPLAPACPHDICALGDKLTASSAHQRACHPCVDQICAQDPYCCNGGYLSYYSSEPVWDAKCVAEVGALCGLDCQN
ncbi:MAG TPA: ADYC domain-containing protein, partial [Polyangia bacterium]|nr:ADYC domain-containing protein [Polyangia bacterium]